MATDGENFFMCFLAIWISSFEKVLFSSLGMAFFHLFVSTGALIHLLQLLVYWSFPSEFCWFLNILIL
jgi:hypothetical protein